LVKQYLYRPGQTLGSQEVEAPLFKDNRQIKVVRSSALLTGRLYPQEIFLVLRLSQPQGHSAAGRMSMKNSSNTIGNRTLDLPVGTAVPQPTAPSRAPSFIKVSKKFYSQKQVPVGGTDDVSTLRTGHRRRRGPFPANYKTFILAPGVMTGVGVLSATYSMDTVSCTDGNRVAEA